MSKSGAASPLEIRLKWTVFPPAVYLLALFLSFLLAMGSLEAVPILLVTAILAQTLPALWILGMITRVPGGELLIPGVASTLVLLGALGLISSSRPTFSRRLSRFLLLDAIAIVAALGIIFVVRPPGGMFNPLAWFGPAVSPWFSP